VHLNQGDRGARISVVFEAISHCAVPITMTLQLGWTANAVNDCESLLMGNSVSLISAAGESIVDHSTLISKNSRMRYKLGTIASSSRCIHAKGKSARQRHHKISAEDLNNAFAIREFLRRSVFLTSI